MKRVLLKLSGEMLAGEFEHGIDTKLADWLAREVGQAREGGCQVVIMIGGGNFVRGAQVAGGGIKRVTGDHMGMLGTMMNAIALTDIFEAAGLATRCLSNIFAQQVAESFSHRLAEKHLESGRVVIVAGGVGRPYITTDTAAINLALELDCEMVLKATKVDGVYDKDPAEHADAVKFESLDYARAVEDPNIRVMDKAAMAQAQEYHMPIIIFDALKDGNITRACSGEPVGTKIG
jgi:uridylate kinase